MKVFRKIMSWISEELFRQDRKDHYTAGMLITLAIGTIHPVVGVVAAILAGLGKELVDCTFLGKKFELTDWLATSLGGLTVGLFRLLEHLNATDFILFP